MSRAYDIAFKLNGQLNGSYKNAFSQAEAIAQKTTSAIKSTIIGLAGIVISTAGIKDFVDTYKDYQQAITNTAATAGVEVGSKEYEALDKAARAAGRATTKTAEESAEALGYMALAGWDTQQSIAGLMPVLRLSEATQADLATTSDLVTDSMSALGLEVSDLSRYLDIAAQANNKSNQTATQMLEAYIGVGGTFKNFNTDLTESAALLGVLANRGIKGAEAGTKMQSLLINLQKKSGESFKAMEALGVSAFDSNGQFKGWTATLKELHDALGKIKDDETRANYLNMIGGKTQKVTLDALLNGFDTIKDGVPEIYALQSELDNSNGALDRMAQTMNGTFGSSMKLLNSAWDDLKISVVEQIEPYITPLIRSFADKLPEMSDKVVKFMHNAGGAVQGLWSKGKALFGWISGNKNTIGSALAGIGGAILTYKLGSTAVAAAHGLAALMTVVAANPVAAGLLATAAGIGAVVYNIVRLRNEAKEANLAEHFGNISLSLDEARSMAEDLFKSDTFNKFSESAESLKYASEMYGEYKNALKELDKLNYKAKLDVKFSEEDIQAYKDNIQKEIESAMKALENEEYGLHLSAAALFGSDSEVAADVTAYYQALEGQCAELGEQLAKAVNDAFADGTLDPDEMANIEQIQANMNKLMNGMAESERNAKLEMLKMKYNGKELDAESYKLVMDEANAINEKFLQDAEKSTWSLIAMYDAQLRNGEITKDIYNSKVSEIEKAYLNARSQQAADISSFGTDVIAQAYSKEIAKANAVMQENYDNFINNETTPLPTKLDAYQKNIVEAVGRSTADAMKEVWNSQNMTELMNDAMQYLDKDMLVPQKLADAIKESAIQGIIAGDADALDIWLGMQTAEVDPSKAYELLRTVGKNLSNEMVSGMKLNKSVVDGTMGEIVSGGEQIIGPKAYAIGESITAGISKGMQANRSAVAAQAEAIRAEIQSRLNSITASIRINLSKNWSEAAQNSHFGGIVKGFASGTDRTPDTFIAGEKGAELITNAAGYKVYDALETGRLFEKARELWAEFDRNASAAADIWAERSGRIEMLRGGGRSGETNITVTMPSIVINGNADSGTAERIKEIMEGSKDEVVREILRILDERESRRERLSN